MKEGNSSFLEHKTWTIFVGCIDHVSSYVAITVVTTIRQTLVSNETQIQSILIPCKNTFIIHC